MQKVKTAKKTATALLIAYLATVAVAYAATTIFTNVVRDEVTEATYTFDALTKDSPGGPRYSLVTFSGVLRLAGAGVGGKQVYLLRTSDNATWIYMASNTTLADGSFRFTINRTDVGTFWYKVGFDVP